MRFGEPLVTALGKKVSRYQTMKITHINRIKDHQLLQSGHQTRYWCCQDQNQKSKPRPSQREGAKHRDTLGMHRYDCRSKLNISLHINQSDKNTYQITISLEHHMKHTPYYDVSLPPEAAALIRDNLEWFSPHEVTKLVLQTYPSITTNQVHAAWTMMSETLWKRDKEQLPSVKLLLGELENDVAVLDLPRMEGVEQVAWVMKKIVFRLQGKIVEIGIDATCKIPSKCQKLHTNEKYRQYQCSPPRAIHHTWGVRQCRLPSILLPLINSNIGRSAKTYQSITGLGSCLAQRIRRLLISTERT
jgi:hypothetical protein